MPITSRVVVGSLVLAAWATASGCAARTSPASQPPPTASASDVAHALLAAYQAGDATALHRLTAGGLRLGPGDLGRVTDVRWKAPIAEGQAYPGFASDAVYVGFDAATTGSPDESIPPQQHWTWGFVVARRSATSRWLVIDDGVV